MLLALEDGLFYVRNHHGVSTCSYRSFTPTYMPSIPLHHSLLWYSGTRIIVTPDFISEVLRVPKVDLPDYPSHPRLSSISRDELALLFYEKAMLWEGTLNFSTTKSLKDHGSLIW